ncbi:hypothetical protein BDN72DRAFT_829758 [Pluteus cervinus]|uniref:Uncharacterized protein n=1 Tax=Pluteus cervinus TaxID=181527 RepID=A0ACD3BGD2_9AGAR|nr:hypothetical protein BDN72DRAFT_829758 [Pluteus cervinus]
MCISTPRKNIKRNEKFDFSGPRPSRRVIEQNCLFEVSNPHVIVLRLPIGICSGSRSARVNIRCRKPIRCQPNALSRWPHRRSLTLSCAVFAPVLRPAMRPTPRLLTGRCLQTSLLPPERIYHFFPLLPLT